MPFQQGHAILIGVGSHRFIPRLDVPISVSDAQAVAQILHDQKYCGYPAGQVKVLSHADATAANILDELNALAGRVKKTDTVTFFYEGHGDYGTDGGYYLITHDAQADGNKVIAGTGLSQIALLDALRRLPAERVLLIFNACHAGELAPSSFGAAEGVEAAFGAQTLPNTTADALLSTGSGRIILSACREDQRSYIGSGKLSLFTQALVDALQGKGLVPRGGFISIFDLYTAVYESVQEKALLTLGREQHPELTVLKGSGPFAVALYHGATQTDLGLAEATTDLPDIPAVRPTSPEKSQRLFQMMVQVITQTGGVNFGQNNQVTIGGNVIGSQEIVHADGSKGFIYKPAGPVEQVFGDKVAGDKVGGDKISGDKINTGGGDFVGRDQNRSITPAPSMDQLIELLEQLRIDIQSAGLPDRVRRSVEIDLEIAEAEARDPLPNQSVILTRLQSLRAVLENAAGAGGAALALFELALRALDLAGQIFR